jgi:hypothetical protein
VELYDGRLSRTVLEGRPLMPYPNLSITSIESIQAFVFYLMQYSISNLNAFIILVAIGFSFYFYVTDNKEHKELLDKNNSPEREGGR